MNDESHNPNSKNWPVTIFGALMMLFGIAICLTGAWDYRQHSVLKTSGTVAPGIVTSSTFSTLDGARSYQANYRFSTNEGTVVTGIANVDKAFYLRACKQENMPISVLYQADNPRNNALPGFTVDTGAMLGAAVFGLLAFGFGLALVRGDFLAKHFTTTTPSGAQNIPGPTGSRP